MAAASEPLLIDVLRGHISRLTGHSESTIGNHDDLVATGLDSIGVMKIASLLRARGVQVKFDELIARRTLAEWWQLIEGRMAAPVSPETPDGDIDESAPYELAAMQHAYWIGRASGQILNSGCHYYFEFDGTDVDPVRLESALDRLLNRHAMLRARFLDDGRQMIQDFTPGGNLVVRDLRSLPESDAGRVLATVREEESCRRLEVERGMGVAVQLSLLPGGATRLHFNVDMLVCDALSFRILIDEMAHLYDDTDCQLAPIDYSYARYLAQKKASRQANRERAKAYWQKRLGSLTHAPGLPLATGPDRVETPRPTRREHWIPPEQWSLLTEHARRHGVTLPMALLTAYTEVLAAWSGDPQFVVNIPLFDREEVHPDVRRLVGDFTNSVLLGIDASGETSFQNRVRQIQARFRSDAANSAYTGVEVLRDLSRARPGESPTAASVVFTSAVGMGDFFGSEAPRQFGRLCWMISQTSQVWLDCQVTELNGGLMLNWDAVEQLLPATVLDPMFQAFVKMVAWMVEQPNWDVPSPSLIPEEQLLVRRAINSRRRARSGRLLHAGFFEHASRHPGRLALAWGDDGRMTYGELAGRARRLARVLVEHGARPGDLISITLPKGSDQVVAILAVLYAGGVYVPIGADLPAQRRERLYAIARSRIVIVEAALRGGAEWAEGIEPVAVEEADGSAELETPAAVSPSSLAYVIFTSGSTGEPKGVMVPHAAAMNTIEHVLEQFAICADDRVLSVSSIDFDWSVADFFELLSVGGAVVLTREQDRLDAVRWVELVRRWGVTLWQSVPALLDMLLTAASDSGLGGSLRLAMLGGDWVGLDLYDRVQQAVPGCGFVALGGITETAIHITSHVVAGVAPHWRSIPYGQPLTNVTCRVVDFRGRDCPDGTPGELWVGGAGLATGYLGDPALTARKFVQYDGERWYRSGDQARYWPDGTLEFLGRVDSQVKIRGHRIELGEVQAALEEHPDVRQAFVTTLDAPERRLAAAVILKRDGLDQADLRCFAAARLPGYMTPAQISIFDRIPLTANGKMDVAEIRRVLAARTAEPRATFAAPASPAEETLAALWKELLGVPEVAREDNFFALGGDSLVATRLVQRLRLAGLEGFNLRGLFTAPQLKDAAATLRFSGACEPEPVLTADPTHRHEPFPLTEIQRAYWLGRRPDFVFGGVGSYWYWEFDGEGVDLGRLEDALNRVIERHDMLRAVVDEEGSQRVLDAVPHFSIALETAAPGDEGALAGFTRANSQRVLDARTWPAFLVRALRYGGRTRIGFGFDYIFVDALSIMVIFTEMAKLYQNPASEMPALRMTFRDYIQHASRVSRDTAADREFWLKRLADLPPAPRLPLARNPDTFSNPRFSRRGARLDSREWGTLLERARQDQVTPSAVLSTAFAQVLCMWSGQKDLTLNFTLFDRQEWHPDVNRIAGDFTSLLLAPYRHDPGAPWRENVRAMQEQIAQGLEHRAVSALWVMREMARRESRTDPVMPIVFTSTLGVADDLVNLSLPFGNYAGGLSQTPQVYLDCQVVAHRGELLVNWDGVEELFPPGMLDAMFDTYVSLLRRLAAYGFDWGTPAPLPLPARQLEVRHRVNATTAPFADRTLHDAFFERAAGDPGRTALLWGLDGRLSYGDLARRALCIAGWLRGRGLRTGDAVAITLPRGPDQVIAALGILAAGGLYVPVGIEQPAARRERMCRKADVSFVLTHPAEAECAEPLDAPVRASTDSVAYVIYTSGSTGEPKGVAVSHRSAWNTIDDINTRFDVQPGDRVLAISALDFDLSVYDIFGLLAAGGSVVVLDDEGRRDPRNWVELAAVHGVTLWNSVPALLEMFLTAAREDLLPDLRLALASGDWVPLDMASRLRERAPSARLVALGGATEAAIWSNYFEVGQVPADWQSIPYGRPLRNQKFRVVNEWGGDCPDWTPGELWIGGSGVAKEYRGDSQVTAEKFIEADGERWYRTGDVGRYFPGGVLEFLGRKDQQIKLRGYRIELGEIEAALESHPSVSRAVASLGSGGQGLAAAVVARDGASFDAEALRAHLGRQVPCYMIPQSIVAVESLPLTANGKVDRSAIASLTGERREISESDPPRPGLEEEIARMWGELMPGGTISRDRSFFSISGDSLLAIRFVEQARRRFGCGPSLRQLLDAPTIREVAQMIVNMREDVDSAVSDVGVI